jgi:hypothetical protein
VVRTARVHPSIARVFYRVACRRVDQRSRQRPARNRLQPGRRLLLLLLLFLLLLFLAALVILLLLSSG